jgi:hypothetical protein
MREAWHVAHMGEKRNAYRILVRKPEGKRPLGRPRCMWVNNIKMGLREIVWGGMGWISLAQDRNRWRTLGNTIPNLRVPQNVGKFPSSCIPGRFSRRAQLLEVRQFATSYIEHTKWKKCKHAYSASRSS